MLMLKLNVFTLGLCLDGSVFYFSSAKWYLLWHLSRSPSQHLTGHHTDTFWEIHTHTFIRFNIVYSWEGGRGCLFVSVCMQVFFRGLSHTYICYSLTLSPTVCPFFPVPGFPSCSWCSVWRVSFTVRTFSSHIWSFSLKFGCRFKLKFNVLWATKCRESVNIRSLFSQSKESHPPLHWIISSQFKMEIYVSTLKEIHIQTNLIKI